MTEMFNVQKIFDDYVHAERVKAKAEGKAEGLAESKVEMATTMLKYHEPFDKIVLYTKLSIEEIQKLADSMQQV